MSISLRRHRYRWILTGMTVGVVAFLIIVLVLSQTVWGHRQILRLTLGALADRVEGTVVVESVSGNLLQGAMLRGISIHGADGEPFALVDSAFLNYRLRSFAIGDMVIRELFLYEPSVFLRKMPGDTLWNLQRIFPTDPRRPPEERRPIIIRHLELVDGLVVFQSPWEPAPGLPAGERERRIELALADTSRQMVTEVPGGYLRTYRFERLAGISDGLIVARDQHGGSSVRIAELSGDIFIWRDPLELRGLEGALRVREGRLEYLAERLELPGSRLHSFGLVPTGDPDVRLDVTLRGDTVSFPDFRWLWPRFPEAGGGTLHLVIERRQDGLLYLARDLRLRTRDTLLRGEFGLIVGDTLRFVDVNLDADPVDLGTLERMLPVDIPVTGLHVGGIQIRTPAP